MHAYNLYFLHQLLTHYMTNSSQISHNFEVAAYFTHLFIVWYHKSGPISQNKDSFTKLNSKLMIPHT